MNKKLYALMNWPEIEGVVYSEEEHPYSILGGKMTKDGFLIQVFRPDAVTVTAVWSGGRKKVELEKVDEGGFFAGLIPSSRKVKYTLIVENKNGRKFDFTDPYSFEVKLTDAQKRAFCSGSLKKPWELLGAHGMKVDGVEGVRFVTWAPEAVRVSVVGEFSGEQGRVLPMEKDEESGLFVLFVPGISETCEYQYEVKARGGAVVRKDDPYACDSEAFAFHDEEWMAERANSDVQDDARSILTVEPAIQSGKVSFFQKLKKETLPAAVEYGFDSIFIRSPLKYRSDAAKGNTAYLCDSRFGTAKELKEFVDAAHQSGVSVLMDLNVAFITGDSEGLVNFDGAKAYEMFVTRTDKYPGELLFTPDFSKAPVRMYYKGAAAYWMSHFHIDGFRLADVATTLYLDYGKNPGEWIPNIYGGNENLYAISFYQEFNRAVHKVPGVITIAQEESAFSSSTGTTEESLGFDFKCNEDFTDNLLSFEMQDPLFRKGVYDKLSESMIYHYMEEFILPMKASDLKRNGADTLVLAMPEEDEALKELDAKLALSYLYTMPGKKLVEQGVTGLADGSVLKRLNQMYKEIPAFSELDSYEEGFAWVCQNDAERTVLAYLRNDSKDNHYLVICNFTPVDRTGYRLGVPYSGSYKVIFDSANAKVEPSSEFKSHLCKWNHCEDYIDVDVSGLSCLVLSYRAFDEFEKEEIRIRQKAEEAKREALKEKEEARLLEEEAKRKADAAHAAEEKAKQAALEAQKAEQAATLKAKEATALSRTIERETKKKLEALAKKFSGSER